MRMMWGDCESVESVQTLEVCDGASDECMCEVVVKGAPLEPDGKDPLLTGLAAPATAEHHPQEVGFDPGHPLGSEERATQEPLMLNYRQHHVRRQTVRMSMSCFMAVHARCVQRNWRHIRCACEMRFTTAACSGTNFAQFNSGYRGARE